MGKAASGYPSTDPARIRRLWLAISGHGHGHLVQVSPLIHALRQRFPSLELSVQSSLPATLLRQTFGDAIRIHAEAVDFGMIMDGPMTVLTEPSLRAYQDFHDDWEQKLAQVIRLFDEFQPDLVIGDIPYLPLAAARIRQIPSVAVCSLNWADILEHYCSAFAGVEPIVSEIRSHYASADLFLRPMPSMPMKTLPNTWVVGPLIATGMSQRDRLNRMLTLPEGVRLVLISLGGIAGQVDVSKWPPFQRTVFLVPSAWTGTALLESAGNRFHSIESTGIAYADLFASCDAMITKPGYGAFVGAACAGLPVLYAERGDWPEERYLSPWLKRTGRAEQIGWTALLDGDLENALDRLMMQEPKTPVAATGAAEGAELIADLLRRIGGPTNEVRAKR